MQDPLFVVLESRQVWGRRRQKRRFLPPETKSMSAKAP
jgi:hypothetical protein